LGSLGEADHIVDDRLAVEVGYTEEHLRLVVDEGDHAVVGGEQTVNCGIRHIRFLLLGDRDDSLLLRRMPPRRDGCGKPTPPSLFLTAGRTAALRPGLSRSWSGALPRSPPRHPPRRVRCH